MSNLQISLTSIRDSFLDPEILEIYYDIEHKQTWKNNWSKLHENKIWKELCFCLLSGNVAYELVQSVITVLERKKYLDYSWILEEKQSKKILYDLFSNPNFEPKKKDGSLRKYRYPEKRSGEITRAAKILYSDSTLKSILENTKSDIEIRNFLAKNVPGIGIKESSHFLRNIGYSNTLAIIDIHVLNFLKQNQFVDPSDMSTLTPLKYEKLESVLQNLADFHELDLGILDLAIWHYMRNKP